MVVCWSRDPSDRPSANEIVSYASRPEFCSLRSSVAVGDGLQAVCACCVTMATGDVISPRSSALEGQCCYWLIMLRYPYNTYKLQNFVGLAQCRHWAAFCLGHWFLKPKFGTSVAPTLENANIFFVLFIHYFAFKLEYHVRPTDGHTGMICNAVY